MMKQDEITTAAQIIWQHWHEAKRMAELPELLATLKKDAPLVTAAELMKQPKAKP